MGEWCPDKKERKDGSTGIGDQNRIGRGMCVPALVTNKHVVQGYSGTTLLFTVSKDGFPTDETVDFPLTGENCKWYGHPDPDVDLCALPNNLGLVISASRLLEMEDMFTTLFGVKR